MLTPSLQLERSFFTAVEIEAEHNHVLGQGEVEVRASQTLGLASKDAALWVVELDLTVVGKEGPTPPPYRIHLHSVGTFSFAAPATPEADKARLLAVTGVSILYSQAREYLLILTARGPWGSFQLPTVSFIDNKPTGGALASHAVREPASEYQSAQRSGKKSPRRRSTLKHVGSGQDR
jgi:hypothetical protein